MSNYKIDGVITLIDKGYPAIIRIYDSLTGYFIKQLETDNIGNYECDLESNALIDILVFSKNDNTNAKVVRNFQP